jgi:hypothetical protein
MTAGILFSQMEPPPELAEEFERWYEADHIPARMALPGFVGARRYRAGSGSPWHLAVYELGDLAALGTPEYLALKAAPSELTVRMLGLARGFTRFTCEQIADTGGSAVGDHLRADAVQVRDGAEAEFDGRLDGVAEPSGEPGVLRTRWFRVVDGAGGPWTHLALTELDRAGEAGPTALPRWCVAQRSWEYTVISSHAAGGTAT